MKKNLITSRNFYGYGIGLLLYINAILDLNLRFLGLRVSEICIIAVLLFVIILIFNEINKLLQENFPSNSHSDSINADLFYKNNICISLPSESYIVLLSLI